LLIELPQAQKFINYFLLFFESVEFRDKAWLINHGAKVEIATQAIHDAEDKVEEYV